MRYFPLRNGVMHAEDSPMTELAEQFGTPLYVYSKAGLRDNFLAYESALTDTPHLVCYAVKANSNLAVLNLLAELGAGFDIVSVGELERVLAAGGDPAKVVFSGVGKLPREMERALEVGIHCFNVESEAELLSLSEVAQRTGNTARVSLRVNPDVDANTHPYISTGLRENKFGVDINRALDIYRLANTLPGINIVGVDCHIGSQLTQLEPFLDALDRVLALIDELANDGIQLEHIDLGGGLGVRYQGEEPPTPEIYVAAIRERLADRALSLILEPGRSIAANAGVLLTEIIYLKKTEHKNFAVIDAAMNDMIRPALYQAWLGIDPVCPRSGDTESYDIVGPVCETGDFLGKDRQLCVEQGDLLCAASSGAYGFSMSSTYNSRGRAAEVMVDGDNAYVVRARETVEDLMRGEQTLPTEATTPSGI
ncbi:MAG: diaminopimelate decarboxylase [bacterium]